MPYPYNDDDSSDNSYFYGLTEKQIRERIEYAIEGEESDDDTLDFGDLNDEEPDDDE